MRYFVLTLIMLLLMSCSSSDSSSNMNATGEADSVSSNARTGGGGGAAQQEPSSNDATLNVEAAQRVNAVAQRRIIRDATLTLELSDPAAAARRVSMLAEESGGFVTSNEARRVGDAGDASDANLVTVIVVARVPAERFAVVLDQIRTMGERVRAEKVTGQDVTEEYLDLEARIRTKQALEAQFLEIMKTARTVEDALAVQRQLGEVRTEIEQLEGRRRYLENRTAFSTITVTLEPPAPLLATRPGSFFSDLARAFGGGLDAAATIVLVLVRVLVALLPVALIVFLPLFLLWRHLKRRATKSEPRPQSPSSEH